jgi:1-acyl-sn-glycerol-3-phosphate acyltransferase
MAYPKSQSAAALNLIIWSFRVLYTTWAILWFVAIMLLIFPFVLLASLWGRIRGGNFIYHILRVWSGAWFFLVGIRPRNIYQHRPDPEKQYIFVINHISYLDAAILPEAIRQPVRPLGKIEMSRVPVFGYIYRMCVVMVDRSNSEHRARSIRNLKSVLKKGISIMIFPEGTFNETDHPLKDFYDGAFRIALETRTPIQPVLFLDAYERMHHRHFFSLNPGPCRVLFLPLVPVEGLTLAQVKELKETVFRQMEAGLIAHGSPNRDILH